MIPEGMIAPDSAGGKALGFTSDKFEGWLWKTGDQITISMIVSLQEGRGNLRALFQEIEQQGYKLAVPTPFERMRKIISRMGLRPTFIRDPQMGPVELWVRP